MGNVAFAASLALLACVTAGIGISYATAKAVEAVARQPEASSKIQTVMLLEQLWRKQQLFMDLLLRY